MKRILVYLSVLLTLMLTLTACTQTTPTTPGGTVAGSEPTAAAPAKTYALPGDQVFPEGIAYDPISNNFFTGSTTNGTVFRGNLKDGQVTIFSPGGQDGRNAATGMKVDSKTRRLWVCGAGTGLIFVYSADNGSLVRKYTTPQAAQTFINDVALAPNGDAYITDSRRPVLFKISGNSTQPGDLESWLDFTGSPVQFAANTTALNGIVVSPDGDYIIVVHTAAQKLYRITVATKEVIEVDVGGTPVPGDGMVLEDGMLYVVTRTQTSDAIVRIQMERDLSRGTVKDSFRDESFAFPTTIAKAGNRMLVVNSQFNARAPGQTPRLPFTVSDIPIPP